MKIPKLWLLIVCIMIGCQPDEQGILPTKRPIVTTAPVPASTRTTVTQTVIVPTKVESFDFGVVDSGVCEKFSAEPVDLVNEQCLIGKRQHDVSTADCVALMLAQAACAENEGDSTELTSVCIRGYEVACLSYVGDGVAKAQLQALPVYSAPQSLCSGLTVGGYGYESKLVHEVEISAECLLDQRNLPNHITQCEFMGQLVEANVEMCQQLTTCVEPRLEATFPIVDYAGRVPLYVFPSGIQPLNIDLSCSDIALPTSLHHRNNGCRAMDINVDSNYGNLRLESRTAPVSTMPPEFVAIMEECRFIWGGRYNGAEGVPDGCDPMEFAYAPACISP